MKRLERGLGYLVVGMLALIAGCGLFKPRDPLPGGGPSVSCLTPNTPDNVISNVVARYATVSGVTCYTQMIDTSFAFHPDPADSLLAGEPTPYANWNHDVEASVASELALDTKSPRVVSFDSLYAPTIISSDQRTQTRFYAYHLLIHASRAAPDSSSPDTLFSGRADITFYQGNDAQWHLTQWVDKRDASGLRTWGYLRRLYRVGF
jgi:hypothetical protein